MVVVSLAENLLLVRLTSQSCVGSRISNGQRLIVFKFNDCLKALNLSLFCHQIEAEICFLAHLSDLLVDEELHIVAFFVAQIFCKLVDLLLEVLVCFFDVGHLFREKLTLFREFLLGS